MQIASATTANSRPFARHWLIAGVAALALAGFLALVLASARTPALSSIPLLSEMFHKALVVHVDLSVLAWFLSIACMFWSLEAGESGILEHAAITSFRLGIVFLAVSAFDPRAEALMSNYIPVLTSPLFFLGLMLIFCGVGLEIVHYAFRTRLRGSSPQALACKTAAIITALSFAVFVLSYPRMPAVIEGGQYYNMLFWAGGHILQFTHAQFVILAWVMLVSALAPGIRIPGGLLKVALGIGVLGAAAGCLAFGAYDIFSASFHNAFTLDMIVFNGIGPVIVGVWAIRHFATPSRGERALFTSLAMSLLLFAYGGILGLVIHGQNVTIPAHYHGAIVGITLAFGGAAYALLPRFGYKNMAGTRLAAWQPVVYGFGQMLHITGLAWSGGYGVLRKTPGALGPGFSAAKAAMGLMGLGGAIAVIGGVMFIIAICRAVLSKD